MGLLRPRRRHRHRPPIRGAHLQYLRAPAHQRGVPRHRHRPGHLQEDRGASCRAHPGRVATRARLGLLLHDPGKRQGTMSDAASGRPVEILLVEDNPGDVRLTQETWKECKLLNHLSVVANGEEAMAFLRREAKYAEAAHPDLILLDLNLPKKDGREMLAEIKADEQL